VSLERLACIIDLFTVHGVSWDFGVRILEVAPGDPCAEEALQLPVAAHLHLQNRGGVSECELVFPCLHIRLHC
jgi:hypothetical protein